MAKIQLIKRKPYRKSNIVDLDMVLPRTAKEIAQYLSQYVSGITPALAQRMIVANVISRSRVNQKQSCYLFADDYVESLQRKEDEAVARRKELEKKHGRF